MGLYLDFIGILELAETVEKITYVAVPHILFALPHGRQ